MMNTESALPGGSALPCSDETHGPAQPGTCLHHGEAHTAAHRHYSRRDFLTRLGLAAAGITFSMHGRLVSAFGRGMSPHSLHAMESDRILVLIQLNGGNDGLNTVIPIANDIYYRARPTIGIPASAAISLDAGTGLHPAMAGLRPLWDDGRMAVVHNVGYHNQTRSHFRGTDIWATASDVDVYESTGWAGRYLAESYEDYLTNPPPYPLAVRLGSAAPNVFQSRYGNIGMTFADTRQFQNFVAQGGYFDVADVPDTVYGAELAYVREVTNASFRYVEAVQNAAGRAENLVTYPGGLGSSLAIVARMIRGGLGSRIYNVALGGFDTHSTQGGVQGSHASLLAQIGNAVAAFLQDLSEDGLDERVLLMTFSEFGRTLAENGSEGTDHGAGAPMLLFGKGLQGGLFGTQSDLLDLYGGDPRFSTDYRSVYSTVLGGWFGLAEDEVSGLLGGSYDRLGFLGSESVGAHPGEHPSEFALEQNYPNPFNPATSITYRIDRPGHVRLGIYDVRGSLVRTLVDSPHAAGTHTSRLDASGLASGSYLYRLETPSGTLTRTMTLIR